MALFGYLIIRDPAVHSMLAERVISWTEEWKQDGILLGEAKTLRRLLNRRFGPLSEDIEGKISQATEQQLELWVDNFVDAKTLADVSKS